MAIGVVIAPILLYWEALSSDSSDKARDSPAPSPGLPEPVIPPVVSIRCLNEKGTLPDLQQAVPVRRPGRDSSEHIADVAVEERVAVDGPSAFETRHRPVI